MFPYCYHGIEAEDTFISQELSPKVLSQNCKYILCHSKQNLFRNSVSLFTFDPKSHVLQTQIKHEKKIKQKYREKQLAYTECSTDLHVVKGKKNPPHQFLNDTVHSNPFNLHKMLDSHEQQNLQTIQTALPANLTQS